MDGVMLGSSMRRYKVWLDSGAENALAGFSAPRAPVLYAFNKTYKVPRIHNGASSRIPRFTQD